jgi:hypothetical protein
MKPIATAVLCVLLCFPVFAAPEAGEGPTPAPRVDVSTLTGKVMCGYQGWFNCPGDGADLGWTHWARNRKQPFAPGNVTVDLWPDVSEYAPDDLFETGFRHADGSPARVFSSHSRGTVMRHFAWMRDYGIDGAFIQRFANGLHHEHSRKHKDAVLAHARAGANEAGRTFAVMYDLSGLPKGGTRRVIDDWKRLRGELGVTKDPAYLHHNGQPVVAVWGIGFNDRTKPREYTLAESLELVRFLKNDGCTVMLGIPSGWRTLDRDALSDPQLHALLAEADILSPWTVGRYRDPAGARRHAERYWVPDLAWCRERKIDYLPVVFPGFSWHNLKGVEIDSIPRRKGEFLWSQFLAAKKAGAEMIYVAMFDEVDEGTAIFKCTNEPPVGEGVAFLTYEGLPPDFYLRLTGQGARLLRGEIPPTPEVPVPIFDRKAPREP